MNRRKVIGMGETILDILFQGRQPVAAVPGGSSFNSIVSVGRAGVPCAFVGYTGDDLVGQQTLDFMRENGVDTRYLQIRQGERSALSLAFLDAQGDASYVFYKEAPRAEGHAALPRLGAGDVMLYGSYYAACTGMRPLVTEMLRRAGEGGAIVYYDLNFRRSHAHELEALMPVIRSNFGQSTIVRGSADDFEVMYGLRDAEAIYERHISAHCPLFICTAGAGEVGVCTPQGHFRFQVPPVRDVVSTVGAGDNFNAGFSCALVWQGITREALPHLSRQEWEPLIQTACDFAAEACRSTDNYISKEWGERVRR